MQDGFSWVVTEQLAAMPVPGADGSLADDLAFLAGRKLELLVSLTDETPDAVLLAEHGIESLHIPVRDFQPPTLEQQIEFVDAVAARLEAGGRVGVHCTAGLGRTGTMMATYLVSLGRSAEEAMTEIRELRPGSIETAAQEDAVRAYHEYQGGNREEVNSNPPSG